MNAIEIVFIALAVASVLGLLVGAVVICVRQKAINKRSSVRAALNEFARDFNPGDLVRGPHRLRFGRAQMILQTAESRYKQAASELLENRSYWTALNLFWEAEALLESARSEVALTAAEAI